MARNRIISGGNDYASDIYKQGEELISVQPSIQNAFVISHLNHKSSVLCPKNRNITEQYLALEQLEAHQKKIAKAKGQVDTSAPKSLQSYLSSVENARRNHRKNNMYSSRMSSLNGSETKSGVASPPAEPEGSKPTDQVDEASSSSSSGAALDKCIQTSTVLSTMNSKVADKISWYLEAVCQGEFTHSTQPASRGYAHRGQTRRSSSRGSTSSSLVHHRNMKGDVMDWHHDKFKQSKRPFSPRVLVNNSAKSKVHDMRCYNSPSKKITRPSSSRKPVDKLETSSDIAPAVNNNSYSEWICDQAWRVQIRQKLKSKLSNSSFVPAASAAEQDSFPESQASKNFGCRSSLEVLSQDEESKYLKYLSEVTEDILRSGIYTDRAIKRAFEFHLQFQDKEADRDKLLQLLEQVLEDLSIEDSEDAFKRSVIPLSLKDTTCNSPPEKETLDQHERELILSSNSLSSKMGAAKLPTDLMDSAEPNDVFSSETYITHDLPYSDSNEPERHKSSVSQVYPNITRMNQFSVS